jgi:hypothetical protein
MSHTIWQACPVDQHWLPWAPVSGQWQHPLIAPLTAAEAHRLARKLRSALPGHLFAVRPAATGEPIWPEAMVDHYELAPYV